MALEGDAKEYEEGDHEWTDEEKGAKFAAQMTADTPLELKQVTAFFGSGSSGLSGRVFRVGLFGFFGSVFSGRDWVSFSVSKFASC